MKRILATSMFIAVVLLTTLVLAQEGAPSVARGERVFRTEGCYGCHTIGRFGTPIAPDLSRIGARYSRDELARWLANPEAVRPGAHMPQLELDPADIDALAAFLSAQRERS
jgi:cytochrome c oxidase subunit II